MPDWLSIHEPVLVNTIGHSAGVVIFGMLLYFLLINRLRSRDDRSRLAVLAAALAMLWNLGSMVALATGPAGGIAADIIVAASFSVLSLLPAVLLHISLESRHRAVWWTGYALSAIAVALHVVDLLTQAARFHYAALLLVTVGFAALTIISVFLELRQENRAAGSRLAGAMGLFLFAISFVHLGAEHTRLAWSKEIALHHAGLPLALLVLLQDFRFLLLDAFLRFIVNASLAAAALLLAIRAVQSPELAKQLQHPFQAGLLFVSACLLLTLFVYIRNRIQSFLTRVIFLRSNIAEAFQSTMNFRYQRPRNAEWVALTYRYDSGLVVSGVPDAGAALALTPNQQVTIGLACNGTFATLANPLTGCTKGAVTSKLINLPQGDENDDHNPARVKPRNILNLGIGTDNLFHSEGPKRFTASIDIANLTNVVALYNFLSTFSGTHFLQPRTVVARFGYTF